MNVSLKSMPHDSSAPYRVAALYKFVDLPDFKSLREPLFDFCQSRNIRGTILLAQEGINGTVAGGDWAIDDLIEEMRSGDLFTGRLQNLDVKYSRSSEMPFLRMRVRLKSEIVTLRAPEASPVNQVGTYIEPEDWNALISDPNMLVVDTRNAYEVSIGTFEGAIDPQTASFTEFKNFVSEKLDPETHKQVAMFCTGGIRCEKASSYLLAHGFENVFHLEGGILKYLETIPREDSLWRGDCFVFDERVAVGHGLAETDYTLCHACRQPLSPEDVSHPDYIKGVQCRYCTSSKTEKERDRARERQRQMDLAEAGGYAHLGEDAMKANEVGREAKRQAKERSRVTQGK